MLTTTGAGVAIGTTTGAGVAIGTTTGAGVATGTYTGAGVRGFFTGTGHARSSSANRLTSHVWRESIIAFVVSAIQTIKQHTDITAWSRSLASLCF